MRPISVLSQSLFKSIRLFRGSRRLASALLAAGALVINVYAQVDTTGIDRHPLNVAAGFGAATMNVPRLIDYIDALELQAALLSRFATGVEVCGSLSYRPEPTWDLEIDYTYFSRSYNFPQQFGPDATIDYNLNMPSLCAHYIFMVPRSAFKLGGGIGYTHAVMNEETFYNSGKWSSDGVGFLLNVEWNTSFDDHFYSYLSAEIRKGFMSNLHDGSGNMPQGPAGPTTVAMSYFGAGVRFGFAYYF